MIDTDRILEDFDSGHERAYAIAFQDMVVAKATGNPTKLAEARRRIVRIMRETFRMAELLGAAQAVEAVRGARVNFAQLPAKRPLLPNVTFDEAVSDLVQRTPETIKSAVQRTAQAISELYSRDRVIAFARSAEDAVTKRVQSVFADAAKRGIVESDAARRAVLEVNNVRKETEAWTENYARMAFRTNLNTATVAGRFRQARDPAVKAVVPAFRFSTAGDVDVRDNHAAARGLIMATDNPSWAKIAPPLGYSCRCRVSFVNVVQLRRMGRIDRSGDLIEDTVPPNAFPDPGFRHGGRPDLFLGAIS